MQRDWADAPADADPADIDVVVPVPESETVTVFKVVVRRLARQSVLRAGQPSESYSLYCYQHKCKICLKPDRYPSQVAVLAWVEAGRRLPEGEGGRAAHRRAWPGLGH